MTLNLVSRAMTLAREGILPEKRTKKYLPFAPMRETSSPYFTAPFLPPGETILTLLLPGRKPPMLIAPLCWVRRYMLYGFMRVMVEPYERALAVDLAADFLAASSWVSTVTLTMARATTAHTSRVAAAMAATFMVRDAPVTGSH